MSTLSTLVTVLGISLGEVFDDRKTDSNSDAERDASFDPSGATESYEPVSYPETRPVVKLGGGVEWARLTSNEDQLVEFMLLTYPPGAASCDEDALLRHQGKEYGYVISGQLGVQIGFNKYVLDPGMAISFDSSAPHRLWTFGEDAVEVIWIVVGRQSGGTKL